MEPISNLKLAGVLIVLLLSVRPSWAAISDVQVLSSAQEAMSQNNLKKANLLYRKVLEGPSREAALVGLASLYGKLPDSEEIAPQIKEFLEKSNPFSIELHLAYAKILSQQQEYSLALEHLDTIEKLRAGYSPAQEVRAAVLFELKQFDVVVKILTAHLSKSPDQTTALLLRGKSLVQLGKATEGLADFKRLAEDRPFDTAALLALGDTYALLGQTAKAEATYLQVQKISPQSVEAAEKLSTVSCQAGPTPACEDYLKKLIQFDPAQSSAVVRLAQVFQNRGAFQDAETNFKRALRTNPEDEKANEGLIEVYTTLGRLDQVGVILKTQFEKTPSNDTIALKYSKFLASLGNVSLADSVIAKCIESATDLKSADVYLYSAYLKKQAAQLPEAIRVLTVADGKFKEDSRVKFNLGLLLQESGDKTKAAEIYKSIQGSVGPAFKAKINLALLQEAAGHPEDALATLKTLPTQGGSSDFSVGKKITELETHLAALKTSPSGEASKRDPAAIKPPQGGSVESK